MGGITELCKVFTAAAIHNVTVMLHSFYDGPGLLARSRDRRAGNGRLDDRMALPRSRSDSLGVRCSRSDGRIRVPQGPGLGMIPTPR